MVSGLEETSGLDRALDTVRVRFGSHALVSAARLPPPAPWPTGLGPLDRLTGIGGLPQGRIGVLEGRASCGKLSLGLALLARATREMAQAVVIDPGRSFDAWALSLFDPVLDRLAVLRPPGGAAAGEAAAALARAGVGFMLLLLPVRVAEESDSWLHSVESAAARSGAIAVAVVEAAPRPLAHASSLSLGLERSDWIFDRGHLVGLRARVLCIKNRVGAPGGVAELEFRYPLGPAFLPGPAVKTAQLPPVLPTVVPDQLPEVSWASSAG